MVTFSIVTQLGSAAGHRSSGEKGDRVYYVTSCRGKATEYFVMPVVHSAYKLQVHYLTSSQTKHLGCNLYSMQLELRAIIISPAVFTLL